MVVGRHHQRQESSLEPCHRLNQGAEVPRNWEAGFQDRRSEEGAKMLVPEHRLWSAVILNTVQEWLSGPLGLSQPAEQYLFNDEKDFPLVCECAGMDPGRLRSRLVRMRRQQKEGVKA